MNDPETISRAFVQAVGLEGDARDAFMVELRRNDPATAEEVASLLGYHMGESAAKAERTATAGHWIPQPSVLDRPAAALLGLGENEEGEPVDEDPPLPPGTLLIAEGFGELDTGGAGGGSGGAEAWSYKVIRELGRGGMGVVYEAEQAFPSRRVALKLLRGGISRSGTTGPLRDAGTRRGTPGTPGLPGSGGGAARRLMLEAEALGALHHPGIAHVYAAGTLRLVSDADEPESAAVVRGVTRWLYISMELVEGPTLGEWGRTRGIREKVAMLADVCDAVEHAHQRGVVHRDLKPGNVLIETGGGSGAGHGGSPPAVAQPKVLDFGVARFTGRNKATRHNATLNVGRGQLIGTLRYMSPEQAGVGGTGGAGTGAPVADSRSDVYSLGAMLYELLTGLPPIPVDDASIVGAVERITTVTPARPKNLAAEIGTRRATDLETVLLKSLEKDPSSRYQHAVALGDDLRRVLRDEPIAARPPTGMEQLARLIRRNKVASAGVGAGLVLLLAGLGVATWQAVLANRSAGQAREEAAVSKSALAFMGRMISAGTPIETRGQDVTVQEMLRGAVRDVRSMPDDRATATACKMLGEALQDIGQPAEAEPLARRALAISRQLLGDDDRRTIEAGLHAAHIAAQRGRQPEAVKEVRALRARCLELFGPDDRLSLRSAMALEYALGVNNPDEVRESEDLLNDTIARARRTLGPSDDALYAALNDLCVLLLTTQRPKEALPIAKEVYETRLERLGEDHPETIVSMGNYTAVLSNINRLDEAIALNARNIELANRVLGPDHPTTLFARQNRTQFLLRTGRLSDAEKEGKAVWEARARRLGADTRLTMTSRGIYLTSVLYQGRFTEVEPMIRDYIARSEQLFGPDDDDTLTAVTLLYDLAEGKGDKATVRAVTARLKGTRFDPVGAPQGPPIKPAPGEPVRPPEPTE